MNININKSIAAGVVLMIAVTGCARKSVNTIRWTGQVGSTKNFETNRIITDSRLARQIVIENANREINRDGFLKAQVTLRNTTNKMRSIEYRFEWVDTNNMAAPTPASRWIIKHIYGGDTVTLTGVAPNAKVRDYILKLKRR